MGIEASQSSLHALHTLTGDRQGQGQGHCCNTHSIKKLVLELPGSYLTSTWGNDARAICHDQVH